MKIAREYDVLVLTEDVYNTLAFDQAKGPPMRLFAYDRRTDEAYKGNVISNGTFSKILAPGVRVGWLETPPRALRILHQSGVLAGGAANNYTSGVIVSALELNLVNRVFEDNIQVYAVSRRSPDRITRQERNDINNIFSAGAHENGNFFAKGETASHLPVSDTNWWIFHLDKDARTYRRRLAEHISSR